MIAAAVLGAYVAGGFGIYRDINKEKNLGKQQKIQAYGQLVGVKSMLLHSYVMYYNAQMVAVGSTCRSELDTYYHRLNGMDEISIEEWRSGSINFIVGCEARNKFTEMELQLAKTDERFWKTISQIQILFSHMFQLQARISLIHQTQKPLETYRLQFDAFMDRLPNEVIALLETLQNGDDDEEVIEDWSLEKQTEINDILRSDAKRLQALHEALESKIDGLLNYLKLELDKSYRATPEPRQQLKYQMRA